MMDEDDALFESRYTYKGLIEHDTLKFLTLDTLKDELNWAEFTKGCFACGRTQPDCELIWAINEELLADAQRFVERDLRVLCRPRRWMCAFDTEAGTPRVLCPSCYRLVQFDCIEGVWVFEFMEPNRHLQMLLPFADPEPLGG